MSNDTETLEAPSGVRKRSPIPLSECGLSLVSMVVGDKWTLLILREALYGVQRFEDIVADLGASRSVLTQRLNQMVEDGILKKEPYREAGSRTRFAYKLTDLGMDLALPLFVLADWGNRHILKTDTPPVWMQDRETGKRLRLAFMDEEGNQVGGERVELKMRERESVG